MILINRLVAYLDAKSVARMVASALEPIFSRILREQLLEVNHQFKTDMSDLEQKLIKAEQDIETAIGIASDHFTKGLASLKQQLVEGASSGTLNTIITSLEADAVSIGNIGAEPPANQTQTPAPEPPAVPEAPAPEPTAGS